MLSPLSLWAGTEDSPLGTVTYTVVQPAHSLKGLCIWAASRDTAHRSLTPATHMGIRDGGNYPITDPDGWPQLEAEGLTEVTVTSRSRKGVKPSLPRHGEGGPLGEIR